MIVTEVGPLALPAEELQRRLESGDFDTPTSRSAKSTRPVLQDRPATPQESRTRLAFGRRAEEKNRKILGGMNHN